MSVILVVEPDSRHAAQLAAMARKHLTAELVMADSASRAVAAMADRVPDVLLMSSLLSRQDEATLAAWLRNLGPAAAHVQELTIPILVAAPMPVPVPKRRGVLSGLRGTRGDTAATDGCGLDEFARQVSAYVGFAYAHRGIAEPVVAPDSPCHVEPAPAPPEADVVRIKAATVEGIGDREDGWIAIALDDACKEPAPPRQIWALTPVNDHKELLVVAAAPPQATPEPIALTEPRSEPESIAIAGQEPAAIAPAAPPGPRPTTKKKDRKRGRKPAQDEGGLFDPEQCGFAALVAKLNEITDNNHAEQASADTTVPLIAY
jgi:CheY-like chemotaxis protein